MIFDKSDYTKKKIFQLNKNKKHVISFGVRVIKIKTIVLRYLTFRKIYKLFKNKVSCFFSKNVTTYIEFCNNDLFFKFTFYYDIKLLYLYISH
jgi:hypothetical protein